MPIKKRTSKARAFRVSAEAAARWRDVREWAIAGPCIQDDQLASALGIPALIAFPPDKIEALRDALDEAADAD